MLAARLPTEDQLLGGLLPPISSPVGRGVHSTTDHGGPGTSPQSWLNGYSGAGHGGMPAMSAGMAAAAPSWLAPVENSSQERSGQRHAEQPVRSSLLETFPESGPVPRQDHQPEEQRQRQRQRQGAADPSDRARPAQNRAPLRGANVTARAPLDADSGTDTDGDDDLLERVR